MPRERKMSREQRLAEAAEEKTSRERQKNMPKYLSGGQAKLDKNKNNKIDAQDFKILRQEKAKGRGKGLQDTMIDPGKVTGAKRGKSILTEKGTDARAGKTFSGYSKPFEGPRDSRGRVATISGVKPRARILGQRKKFKTLEAMRKDKGFKMIGGKQETAEQFNRRKAREGRVLRAAKSTRVGKILLPVVGAALAAKEYLKSKSKKTEAAKNKNKKMAGGIMKKRQGGLTANRFTQRLLKENPSMTRSKSIIDKIKKLKKAGKLSKGGGADTGTMGERKSKLGVALQKIKRSGVMGKKPKTPIEVPGRSKFMTPLKKMGGGMMQRPMGQMGMAKKGQMIKARGGGMARTKPTSMY